MGSQEVLAVNLANVAMLAVATQRPAAAARLFGAAVGQREAIGNPFKLPERAVYDRAIDAARAVLPRRRLCGRLGCRPRALPG